MNSRQSNVRWQRVRQVSWEFYKKQCMHCAGDDVQIHTITDPHLELVRVNPQAEEVGAEDSECVERARCLVGDVAEHRRLDRDLFLQQLLKFRVARLQAQVEGERLAGLGAMRHPGVARLARRVEVALEVELGQEFSSKPTFHRARAQLSAGVGQPIQ